MHRFSSARSRLVLTLVLAILIFASAAAATTFYSVDFESGKLPSGLQCQNLTNTSHATYGKLTLTSTNPGQGSWSGQMTLPSVTNGTLQRCQVIGPSRNLTVGDDYFTLMLYVSSADANNYPGVKNSWGSGVIIAEPGFQTRNTGGQAPFHFWLGDSRGGNAGDSVALGICTGKSNCQYNSTPYGVGSNLPNYYLIPPGQLTAGWHEMIFHVHTAPGTAGVLDGWQRLKGQTTWTQEFHVTGIPTCQYGTTGTCGGTIFDAGPQAYRGPTSTTFAEIVDDFTRDDSFAAAAAVLP